MRTRILALAVCSPLLVSAAAAKRDCERLRDAHGKISDVSNRAWGGYGAIIPYYLGAAYSLTQSDSDRIDAVVETLATVTDDPVSGGKVDCAPLAEKLNALKGPLADLGRKFDAARNACLSQESALKGDCARVANPALDESLKFRKGPVQQYYAAWRAAPELCRQNAYGLAELHLTACARNIRYNNRTNRLCAFFELNKAHDKMHDAAGKEIEKIKSEPLKTAVQGPLGPLRDSRDRFGDQHRNPNLDNKTLFRAAINAAVANKAVHGLRCAFCGYYCPPDVAVPGTDTYTYTYTDTDTSTGTNTYP